MSIRIQTAQERLTSHFFDRGFCQACFSGSAVRVPADTSIWPPVALFDAVYASAVLRHFGVAMTDILENWRVVFCPDGPMKAAGVDNKRRRDQADADKETSNAQKAARQSRYDSERRYGRRGVQSDFDAFDMLMMYRFQAMEPEKVRAHPEGYEEVAAARQRKRLDEKVNPWRESLPNTVPSVSTYSTRHACLCNCMQTPCLP
jgi:hypothetical protein